MTRRNVLVAIGGGIAAYKICSVISTLVKEGLSVRAILSPRAQDFITPLTISTLCRHPAALDEDFWSRTQSSPLHIELAEWADVILLAPLTANTLAELNHGFARSLLENVILASRIPVLLAPAMNTVMWQQPVVQRNLETLLTDNRFHAVGPESGRLACDAVGMGKMADPEMILRYLRSLLHRNGQRDFAAHKLLVTAGGTREFMDPVRFIGNPSTGKMGVAIAIAAYHRGASVTLIAGPGVDLPTGFDINIIPVVTAHDMEQALGQQFPDSTLTVMAAAVADMKPATYVSHKLPKTELGSTLDLKKVPDLIHGLAQRKTQSQKIDWICRTNGRYRPSSTG